MRARARLANASDNARRLDEQIRAVYADQELTKQQTCLRVQQLARSASAAIRQQLKLKDRTCDYA